MTLLQLADYPAGAASFGPASLPDEAARMTVSVARCTATDPTIWPDKTTQVLVRLEVSIDGGPWMNGGSFGAYGGVHIRRDGTVAADSLYRSALPVGIRRRLRGALEVAGGSLRSQLTLAVS